MKSNLLALSKKKLLFITFIAFYIMGICSSIFRVREINIILNILQNYLDSIPANKLSFAPIEDLVWQSPSYQEKLCDVLAHYPTILKYEHYYVENMGYGQPHLQNYRAAIEHYNNLLMERNYINQDLKNSFNPLTAIKKLFSFPSTFIEWIGFTPETTISKLFNVFTWLIALFMNMYSDEIKILIKLLIHRLFNA